MEHFADPVARATETIQQQHVRNEIVPHAHRVSIVLVRVLLGKPLGACAALPCPAAKYY